jgi:hypothetical protein
VREGVRCDGLSPQAGSLPTNSQESAKGRSGSRCFHKIIQIIGYVRHTARRTGAYPERMTHDSVDNVASLI